MGGLASVLVSALLRPWLGTAQQAGGTESRLPTLKPSWPDVFAAGMHMLAGTGIGMLYWLSWGFAAIVAVPWWVRGLIFGATFCAAIVLPLLLAVGLQLKMRRQLLGALLCEWTCTCILAALACAWSWQTMG